MLEARSISKAYGRTAANDCLTTSIQQGEIVGLLGENGAGKSTFLSILAGRIQPDSGQLFVDGRSVNFDSPGDALRAGISIVFQHFSLVPSFTIREQLRLAGWTSSALPALLAPRFHGEELISRISLGERQLVEIARALVVQPRFLLLDEPTSILTSAETQHLFGLMRDVRNQGTSVVLVTHKLYEAMDICDRIVVLRQGKAVDSVTRTSSAWPEGCENRLLTSMFGGSHARQLDGIQSPDKIPESGTSSSRSLSPDYFRIEDITTLASPDRRALDHICLDIAEGEICAIVGVDGQGQREIAEVCSGYATASGVIRLGSQVLEPGDSEAFHLAGIAYLTDDRLGEGSVSGFSVEDNLIMKRQRDWPFSRGGSLRRRAIRNYAREQVARWHIEPTDPTAPIGTLSGGNVQKVLLARELSIAKSLLVVNKPLQGLDAQTTDLVWDAIRQFADERGSVLLLTTDVDEALEHGDRIAVIYDGKLSPLLPPSTSRNHLERMMVVGWT